MSRMRSEDLRSIVERRPNQEQEIGIFIETGTYRAERAFMARWLFPIVYTIELSFELHHKACSICGDIPGMHLLRGDSAEMLQKVLDRNPDPCVIFLDAHAFSQPGAESFISHENPMPLMAELEAIRARPPGDIVIVDDVHAFDRKGDWERINAVTIMKALDCVDSTQFEFVGDCFVVWR